MDFETTRDAIDYFVKKQAEIINMEMKLKTHLEVYKKETKEYFGVEDGKPISLTQLADLILKLSEPNFKKQDDIEIWGAPV